MRQAARERREGGEGRLRGARKAAGLAGGVARGWLADELIVVITIIIMECGD